ncbi:hypothetical protein D3C76_1580290 [compost metagenome]
MNVKFPLKRRMVEVDIAIPRGFYDVHAFVSQGLNHVVIALHVFLRDIAVFSGTTGYLPAAGLHPDLHHVARFQQRDHVIEVVILPV